MPTAKEIKDGMAEPPADDAKPQAEPQAAAPIEATAQRVPDNQPPMAEPPKKRPGRPKGSKNKGAAPSTPKGQTRRICELPGCHLGAIAITAATDEACHVEYARQSGVKLKTVGGKRMLDTRRDFRIIHDGTAKAIEAEKLIAEKEAKAKELSDKRADYIARKAAKASK